MNADEISRRKCICCKTEMENNADTTIYCRKCIPSDAVQMALKDMENKIISALSEKFYEAWIKEGE